MATTSISTILPRATLKLFSDFGGAARPGRQDGAGETASFTPIVDTRCLDLELAGSRRHRPRLSHAVAHHKGVAGLVAMVDVLGDVLIDFSFERCQQHASHTLAHQLIQIELERIVLSLIRSHYAQHAAYLSMDGLTVARLQQPGGYAALLPRPPSTGFGYTSGWSGATEGGHGSDRVKLIKRQMFGRAILWTRPRSARRKATECKFGGTTFRIPRNYHVRFATQTGTAGKQARSTPRRELRPMGAWGPGSFDNDDAVDWLADLSRSTDLRPIQTTLEAVTRLEPASYLEAPEASAAVAAAEVVAALLGRPAANLPQHVTTWVEAHRQSGATDDLQDTAQRAVARVQASSELRDLWDESDDAGAGWQQQLSNLMTRLAG